MQSEAGVFFVQFILRVIGAVVCYNKANDLNRSSGGWAFFGFALPILARIWIQFMKPVVDWRSDQEN